MQQLLDYGANPLADSAVHLLPRDMLGTEEHRDEGEYEAKRSKELHELLDRATTAAVSGLTLTYTVTCT